MRERYDDDLMYLNLITPGDRVRSGTTIQHLSTKFKSFL